MGYIYSYSTKPAHTFDETRYHKQQSDISRLNYVCERIESVVPAPVGEVKSMIVSAIHESGSTPSWTDIHPTLTVCGRK